MDKLDINPIKNWLPNINNPLLIAGPCSLETEKQAVETAKLLAKDPRVFIYRGGVWKPRTRPGSFEGVGSIGLKWLNTVKKETGLPVGTEVANAQHTEEALNAGIDVLWIGARSTASPFVVQEIADVIKGSDAIVMVKNPVNPDVQLWLGAIERVYQSGIKNIVAIHRGFTPFRDTAYRNYPNWKTVIELRRLMPNLPIICDPSHIAGKREYLFEISQKAFDMGMDGFMIESHIDPSCALSDAAQQLTPADLGKLLENWLSGMKVPVIRILKTSWMCYVTALMHLILNCWKLLSSRVEISKQIGLYKKKTMLLPCKLTAGRN